MSFPDGPGVAETRHPLNLPYYSGDGSRSLKFSQRIKSRFSKLVCSFFLLSPFQYTSSGEECTSLLNRAFSPPLIFSEASPRSEASAGIEELLKESCPSNVDGTLWQRIQQAEGYPTEKGLDERVPPLGDALLQAFKDSRLHAVQKFGDTLKSMMINFLRKADKDDKQHPEAKESDLAPILPTYLSSLTAVWGMFAMAVLVLVTSICLAFIPCICKGKTCSRSGSIFHVRRSLRENAPTPREVQPDLTDGRATSALHETSASNSWTSKFSQNGLLVSTLLVFVLGIVLIMSTLSFIYVAQLRQAADASRCMFMSTVGQVLQGGQVAVDKPSSFMDMRTEPLTTPRHRFYGVSQTLELYVHTGIPAHLARPAAYRGGIEWNTYQHDRSVTVGKMPILKSHFISYVILNAPFINAGGEGQYATFDRNYAVHCRAEYWSNKIDPSAPNSFVQNYVRPLARFIGTRYFQLSLIYSSFAADQLLSGHAGYDLTNPPMRPLAQVTVQPFLTAFTLSRYSFEVCEQLKQSTRNDVIQLLELQNWSIDPDVLDSPRFIEQLSTKISVGMSQLTSPVFRVFDGVGYTIAVLLVTSLGGAVLYLIFKNRQSALKGDVEPTSCIWIPLLLFLSFLLFVAAGVSLFASTVILDGCHIVASLQDPNAMQKWIPAKSDSQPDSASGCAFVRACFAPASSRSVAASTQLEEAWTALKDLLEKVANREDDPQLTITRQFEGLRLLLREYEAHSTLFVYRNPPTAGTPAFRYGGLQENTVEFRSFFDIPGAELIGPAGMTRGKLIPLPPYEQPRKVGQGSLQSFSLDQFKAYLKNFVGTHLVADEMLRVLEILEFDVPQGLKRLEELLTGSDRHGHYRLYGRRALEQELPNFYFPDLHLEELQTGALDANKSLLIPFEIARKDPATFGLNVPNNQQADFEEKQRLARERAFLLLKSPCACMREHELPRKEVERLVEENVQEIAEFLQNGVDRSNRFTNDFLQDMLQLLKQLNMLKVPLTVPCDCTKNHNHLRRVVEDLNYKVQRDIDVLEQAKSDGDKAFSGSLVYMTEEFEKLRHSDCSPIYRTFVAGQRLLCKRVVSSLLQLGFTWAASASSALVVMAVYFAMWQASETALRLNNASGT